MAILAVATGRMAWELVRRFALFDAQVQFGTDAPLYFGMGRGILNGLVPYLDLFETKPPGMYLLSALSLLISGDERWAMLLQIIVLAGIPWLLLLFTAKATDKSPRQTRLSLLLLSFLFGSGLAIFTAIHAGRFQTESFGAFAGIAYLVTLAWNPRQPVGKRRMLFGSFLLMASVGLKEPFVLTLFAAAGLLSTTLARFVRIFVIPVAIAALIGISIMAALGWLDPYLTIYLPEVLGGRLPDITNYRLPIEGAKLVANQPAWLRGFIVTRVFERFLWYHLGIPFVGLAAVFLWLANPALKRSNSTVLSLLASSASVWLGGFLLHKTFYLLQLLEILKYRIPFGDPFFRRLVWEYVVRSDWMVFFFFSSRRRHTRYSV